MGSNLREILDIVSYPKIFLSFLDAKEKKRIETKEKAILEFYQQFAYVGADLVFSESLCKELQKKFFQQKCELGRVGRRNMNRSTTFMALILMAQRGRSASFGYGDRGRTEGALPLRRPREKKSRGEI
jgi:hypothetical protein